MYIRWQNQPVNIFDKHDLIISTQLSSHFLRHLQLSVLLHLCVSLCPYDFSIKCSLLLQWTFLCSTFSYFFSSNSVSRVELRDMIDFKVKEGVNFTNSSVQSPNVPVYGISCFKIQHNCTQTDVTPNFSALHFMSYASI